MNYQAIYDALMQRAVTLHGHAISRHVRKPFKYAILHHIIPVSWWLSAGENRKAARNDRNHPANAPENQCWLTPREHWIAHLCLAITYGGNEWIAVEKMTSGINDSARGIRPNSRLIEAATIAGREANRQISKARLKVDPEWSTRHITPDVVKRRASTLRETWKNSPALYARASEIALQTFHSPQACAKRAASLNTDGYRQLKSTETTENWKDPALRASRIVGMKKTFATPENKARRSEIAKERWKSGSLKATKPARAIIAINKATGEETRYRSMTGAKHAGFNEGNLSLVLSGKRQSSGGYYWRWAEQGIEN